MTMGKIQVHYVSGHSAFLPLSKFPVMLGGQISSSLNARSNNCFEFFFDVTIDEVDKFLCSRDMTDFLSSFNILQKI